MQGCLEKVEDKITYYAPILIGIGIGVAMIQVDCLFYFLANCMLIDVVIRPRSKSLLYSKTHQENTTLLMFE